MAEIARLTPTFQGVSYEKLDQLGSIQWPCNEAQPGGHAFMHVGEFVRGKGYFAPTPYVATDERTNSRYPLLLTTGRILSQYNVGAQTRRTDNMDFHDEDRVEIHPSDAETRGIAVMVAGWASRVACRRNRIARRWYTERVQPGVILHHLPSPGIRRQRGDHRQFRLGHQLPGIQGHRGAGLPGERAQRLAGHVSAL